MEIQKWNGHFQFLIELNTCVAYYSNPTRRRGLISKDIKFYGYTKTCTQLLITVLFIIAPNFKQSKCPSVVLIDEGWYISMQWNTTWQYKRNEQKKHRTNWMNFRGIALNEKNQISRNYILCDYISEKAMATHSGTLAWKIPWTEKPGRLQSMESRRVGHDWSDLAAVAAAWLHLYDIPKSKL